jgi:hypothetical protein
MSRKAFSEIEKILDEVIADSLNRTYINSNFVSANDLAVGGKDIYT